MAKDKQFEAEYQAEKLRRTKIRKEARKEKYKLIRLHKKQGICESCGGQMEWCKICEMWTNTCCEEYGSCMCS